MLTLTGTTAAGRRSDGSGVSSGINEGWLRALSSTSLLANLTSCSNSLLVLLTAKSVQAS